MSPAPRLPRDRLSDHLVLESAATRRLVAVLRRTVLRAAPSAAEAIKFRALCYFHADAWFGAIGGNICFIEIRRGRVLLSFIHGAALPDPAGLLRGKARMKRFIPIPDLQSAADPRITAIIRAAAALRPWD